MITGRQWRKMPSGAILRSADGYHLLMLGRNKEFGTMNMVAVNINTERHLPGEILLYGKAREQTCWMTEEPEFLKLWTRVA